jgi:hypothetical protein
MSAWQPIASYFSQDTETACVLLWADHEALGECGVQLGYWEPDEQAWYKDGAGPDLGSAPLKPTHWMALPGTP